MSLRPLGIAEEIVKSTGLTITYNYDDLIFIEHNPFILQFDDENPQHLNLFFNVDCEEKASLELERQLNEAAGEREFSITACGKFRMKQKENSEELEIEFIE